jgi:hypothetical protein
MELGDYFLKHRWEWCPRCGPMVVCGKCGNNMCNGGSYCEACESAFQLQRDGVVPQPLAERLALWELERMQACSPS